MPELKDSKFSEGPQMHSYSRLMSECAWEELRLRKFKLFNKLLDVMADLTQEWLKPGGLASHQDSQAESSYY